MNTIEQSYINGFIQKCASLGVDGEELMKQAQVNYGGNISKPIYPANNISKTKANFKTPFVQQSLENQKGTAARSAMSQMNAFNPATALIRDSVAGSDNFGSQKSKVTYGGGISSRN